MVGTSRRIVIIGGGIVGAAIAYALTRRGASVTVLEAGQVGCGVTGQAFGWLHHTAPPDDPALKLRHAALEEYRRLEHDTGGHVSVDWCGALTWFKTTAETKAFIQQQTSLGLDVRGVVAAEFTTLEPGLIEPPPLAAFAAREGAVNVPEVARRLMTLAQSLGANLITRRRATEILTQGWRVTGVAVGTDTIPADTVILATGTQGATLVAPLGITLDITASPAILMRFLTRDPLLRRIVSGPEFEARQAGPGSLVAAEDYQDPDGENGPEAIAQRALDILRNALRGAHSLSLDTVQTGWRPIPTAGRPIIGRVPGYDDIHTAILHPAVTLAPLIGRLIADDILTGHQDPLLQSIQNG